MKVVLLKDIPKVGKKYDIKDVSDGHGRNFLIRNKLAELATPHSLRMVEDMKGKITAQKNIEEAQVEAGLAKLSKAKITLKGKANEEGHLFAGIKAEELSDAIKDQTGLTVSFEHINLDKPVKMVGEHEVEVSMGSKKAKFKLTVEKE
ncbi:MAG: 50S ribosomal protein L9 [bacterium]|nr:50S ribosomal protein L9 [bacterium]